MSEAYIGLLVLWPLAAGLTCLVLTSPGARSALVLSTGIALAVGGLAMAVNAPFAAPSALLGSETALHIAEGAAFVLPAYFLIRGLLAKHWLVIVFALGQLALAAYGAAAMPHAALVQNAAVCDGLSLALVLVVCFAGSFIAIFALPYMRRHEEHLRLRVSKQPGFFMILLAFLGFMNGLALSNDIRVFAAFYEATTLCSFLLIGHDKTEIATKNALRALWMNCLGGMFLHGGILLIQQGHGLVDIHEIVDPAVWAGASMLPMALLALAGCVKAAQMPFQSWLLGAMVAPTPVSALLHSSTMVKVGVFLCLRLGPVLMGSTTGRVLALAGAFTFFAASALALGQSNAKKILAYSTIANLGLIIACAGLGTPVALAAGVVLLVIHAATKALLFLCVGDMEQVVGSRDLEDLRGAVQKAPTTALAAAAGALGMILPPLGMLMGKWAAIEASLNNPALLVLMALGSALAVVCWVRFSGTLLAGRSASPSAAPSSILTSGPILGLLFGAIGLGMAAPWINALLLPGTSALAGGWGLIPSLFVTAMLGWIIGMKVLARQSSVRLATPYIGGLPSREPGTFVGALGKNWTLSEGNEYAEELFGEPRLTRVAGVLAGALLLALVGGAII